MIKIKRLIFNSFHVNTFIVSDNTGECAIIDAGCSNDSEFQKLKSYIQQNNLQPIKLLNTHCHVDHIVGNKYVATAYGLKVTANKKDEYLLNDSILSYLGFGHKAADIPPIEESISEGDEIVVGNLKMRVIEAPGHTPGCVVFYIEEAKAAIVGDVLFNGSIGRTDLPGGDYDVMMNSLKRLLDELPSDTIIHCGHGDSTEIGFEKMSNPFLEFIH